MGGGERAEPISPKGVMSVRRWTTWILYLFAFWLAVSTWVYHFTGIAAWSNLVIGGLAIAAGVMTVEAGAAWGTVGDWARAVFGAWLLVSPFVLSGHGTGMAELGNVVLGALILIGSAGLALGVGGSAATKRPVRASSPA